MKRVFICKLKYGTSVNVRKSLNDLLLENTVLITELIKLVFAIGCFCKNNRIKLVQRSFSPVLFRSNVHSVNRSIRMKFSWL